MYTISKYLCRLHSSRRLYSDEATRIKKSIFFPITKFKTHLSADQTIQRDSHIFKVNINNCNSVHINEKQSFYFRHVNFLNCILGKENII